MPTRPPRLCRCGARVSGPCPHCTAQRRQASDARRPTASQRGYTQQEWRVIRARILARDPICRECAAKPSKMADHIVPRREGGSDEDSNLQGLCWSCHSRKTATQDGGFGRQRVTPSTATR